MKSFQSIKLKAAFLLTAFTLNTVISFACCIGIDMGFNAQHHAVEKKNETHSHSGKHSPGTHSYAAPHADSDGSVSGNGKASGQKDNCCNKKAFELQQLDKSSDHSSNPVLRVPVFSSFLAAFTSFELRGQLNRILSMPFITQYYPPPDKRIIIQSFQI